MVYNAADEAERIRWSDGWTDVTEKAWRAGTHEKSKSN